MTRAPGGPGIPETKSAAGRLGAPLAHFSDSKENGLEIRTCGNLHGFRQRGISLCLSLCKNMRLAHDAFY